MPHHGQAVKPFKAYTRDCMLCVVSMGLHVHDEILPKCNQTHTLLSNPVNKN